MANRIQPTIVVGGQVWAETPPGITDGLVSIAYLTPEGRQIVNHDLSLAGENLVHDYQAVTQKPLAVEQDSWDTAFASDATSLVVKASAGRLRQARVSHSNTGGTAVWVMVFNATSAPADGTQPDIPAVHLAAGADVVIDLTEIGSYFDTGITIVISADGDDLNTTGPTAAEHDIFALFK